MVREYTIQDDDGNSFRMGVSVDEVGRGDAIKVGGRLEKIMSISRCGKWDKTIATESGREYGMMQVRAYGKKIDLK